MCLLTTREHNNREEENSEKQKSSKWKRDGVQVGQQREAMNTGMGMDGNSLERESMNLVAKRYTRKARVRNSSETRANHMCMHNCTMRNNMFLITTMFLNFGSDKAQWHMPGRSILDYVPSSRTSGAKRTSYSTWENKL